MGTGDAVGGVEVPPGLAWHYTDGPGLVAILASHTLWATAAPFLNDRQEVALGGRMIVERILQLAADRDAELAATLADRVREATEHGQGPGAASAYILSASHSADSLAMWRLYGGAHESYAIGLDPTVDLVALTSREVELPLGRADGVYLRRHGWRPVRYAREEQVALVDSALELLGDLPSALSGLARPAARTEPAPGDPGRVEDGRAADARAGLGSSLEPFFEALHEALMLIKHEGFVDEREIRYSALLLTRPDLAGRSAEASLLSYRSSAYGIAPYLRLTGPEPQRPEAVVTARPSPLPVRAVAVSPSPNGPEASTSVRQLLLRHGYDVPVVRSAIPFRG